MKFLKYFILISLLVSLSTLLQGKKLNLKRGSDSEVPSKKFIHCLDSWEYWFVTYSGCAATFDTNGRRWCYVEKYTHLQFTRGIRNPWKWCRDDEKYGTKAHWEGWKTNGGVYTVKSGEPVY